MSIVRLSKVAATFACGLLALCLALQLWQAYVLAPWTRDGRVSAQVIRIAPEVSGSVEAVFVADNQRVARGDPLYRIDPRSYRLAVRQREAELEQARRGGEAGAGATDTRDASGLREWERALLKHIQPVS